MCFRGRNYPIFRQKTSLSAGKREETCHRDAMSPKPSPWWTPDVHADRRPFLLARNRIQAALRGWFSARDFIEVDTATLQVSPGNEAHLHAFETVAIGHSGARTPLYLHTSPEFACKKLLAAGEQRIACFAHVYRNRERGPLHHPEFTMVEWYRVGEGYDVLMADCAAILALAATTAGAENLAYRGRTCDPFAEPERLTVADAFGRFANIDLLATIADNGETDRAALAAQATAAGIRVAEDDTWPDIFSRVLVERVEPDLGVGRASAASETGYSQRRVARPTPRSGSTRSTRTLLKMSAQVSSAATRMPDAVACAASAARSVWPSSAIVARRSILAKRRKASATVSRSGGSAGSQVAPR